MTERLRDVGTTSKSQGRAARQPRPPELDRHVQRRTRSRARLWSGDFLGTSLIYRNIREVTRDLRGRLLDLGCGNSPYRHLLSTDIQYIGYDVDRQGSRPGVVGTVGNLPFSDGVFDAILSTQVLEHVAEPSAMLAEVARVLRPGGRLILSAPQYWRLHEEPNDYFRFTRYGLEHLLGQAGLEIDCITAQGGVWRLTGQAITSTIFHRFGANPVTHLAFLLINLVSLAMESVWSDAGDTVNYLVQARRPLA